MMIMIMMRLKIITIDKMIKRIRLKWSAIVSAEVRLSTCRGSRPTCHDNIIGILDCSSRLKIFTLIDSVAACI